MAEAVDAVVVGAGLGGLASAIELASSGLSVVVLERGAVAGGKAGALLVDGLEVDTGPSVLTMPGVLAELFARGGSTLDAELTLREPSPAFRYRWPDGVILDVHADLGRTLESVNRTLGARACRDLAQFMAYAQRIWEAAAPHFVYGPAPSWGHMARLGLGELMKLRQVDPLRVMRAAIAEQVQSPHLRMLLERYATYNGSDPRRAPATLNCIAHVELALGGYGVEGGIYEVVRALQRVAEGLGVRFRFGAAVARIEAVGGRVSGVVLEDGEALGAGLVVANADAAHVAADLLDDGVRHGIPAIERPSMSGWTAVVRAGVRGTRPARVAHEVLFPRDYTAEFADIFDADRPPREPTVYLCAQAACHGRAAWPDGSEPVFLMANAPAEPASGPRPPAAWATLKATVRQRLLDADLLQRSDAFLWERTPTDLARQFPGSRGAIYGAASNDRFAAFRRPANRVHAVPGLYLASGSAHPGGGMPLALLSGRAAAVAALEDRGLSTR